MPDSDDRSLTFGTPHGRGAIWPADSAGVDRAVMALAAGDIVGMPTETVYGLAADATNGMAVARIYSAKGRPGFNPLISHVASLEEAEKFGVFSAAARTLALAFWPGPLTLVVPAQPGSGISDLARAGLPTVALRVPAHPVALALLQRFDRPLAAPSANLSGRISPTTAQAVASDLGAAVALILDGGACTLGVESTVIRCLPGSVVQLRPGGVTRESVEALLGHKVAIKQGDTEIQSPGMMASHYAPFAPLRMNVRDFKPGDAILAFGALSAPPFLGLSPQLNLSPQGDLLQAAKNLFSYLRKLDAYRPAAIAVAPIPNHGLGEAINDRLARASAPRDALPGKPEI